MTTEAELGEVEVCMLGPIALRSPKTRIPFLALSLSFYISRRGEKRLHQPVKTTASSQIISSIFSHQSLSFLSICVDLSTYLITHT